jgi:pyruvate dehydrogenase E1 component alpha subunit
MKVATNIGYFHEALNLSKVWTLPVLWVCENNIYGMGTAVERASAVSEIQQKAEGYGMEHERVDGMDVMAVYESAKKAIAKVRSGSGPRMLEVLTYRKQAEVKKWEEHDPIGAFHAYLIGNKKATAKVLEELEVRAAEEVQKAVEFAEASPEPGLDTLFDNVYVEEV